MISIQLDFGQVPSVLAALADQRNAQASANSAAESFVDDIHDWIAAGKGFTPRSPGGGLEQAINWHPAGNGAAEVYANKDYASYVEQGTGIHVGHRPWVIGPKDGRKGLKIPVAGGGGYIVRRSVIHPGSKPHPFFFADLDQRKTHMQERALSVLAARMSHAGAR